jgi:ZIP family zinc transporter
MGNHQFVIESAIAGIIASLACGAGALPLAIRGLDVRSRIGLGYGFAGGLMIAASVYNLLLPALVDGSAASTQLSAVLQTLFGMFFGCLFLWYVGFLLTPKRLESAALKTLGGRAESLIFIAMTLHSIPEGIAVGVGYGAEAHEGHESLSGLYIAISIAIHNIPEGLAVALPLRANGASIAKCFLLAFLTSLPQPIAAIPASLLVSLFEPLVLPLLGFAAGAMMYLVVVELIPDALETRSRDHIAWSFMAGFGLMLLVQVGL